METQINEQKKSTPTYMCLADVELNNDSKAVVVRLLRTWEARNFKRNKELMSVDFLLLDEKDCVIQGTIHHLLLQKFSNSLKEGRIFIIRDFDVVRSGKNYRVTDHQYMVRFTDATKMEEIDDKKIVIHPEKFCLHSHKQLWQMVNKTEELPDVIGFLYKTDSNEKSEENKTRRLTLHIYLEENIKTRLTIWDDVAQSIEQKLRNLSERTIVIIATSVVPKTFGVHLCLNVSSASKIYLNADFEAVREFLGRTTFRPQFEDGYKNLERNNSDTQLHTIADLLKFVNNEKQEEKDFICKAKITDIILRNGWNYISCSNCARKMDKSKSTISCNYCNDSKAVGVLRFRIEVEVDDGSDTTIFVIFDKEAKKMTQTTASSLMTEKELDADKDNRDKAPAKILDIVGKILKFQVKVTNYNYNAKIQTFTVSRILDDISKSEPEERQQKDNMEPGGSRASSSTTPPKIKIEDSKEEIGNEKHKKGINKRRKLDKKGNKTGLHILDDSE